MKLSSDVATPSTWSVDRRKTRSRVSQPFFLVGAERSGTTLTRLMLDHHPEISFFFEFEYAVDRIPASGGWPDLDDYVAYLGSHRIFNEARVAIDRGLDYPQLIRSFLRQKRDRDGKSRVGATVHRHFDRLLRIWPDARFLHILRDGRDVARSVIEMGWAGNMYVAVERWIEAETLWARMRRELPRDRLFEMRYETLVREPEETLFQICEFIGVSYEPAMLDYPNHSTYGPPSSRSIGQWKTKLSPLAVRLAEARIGAMLAERGYEPSGYPALEVNPALKAWLRFQNRLSCSTFRLRRFGAGLFLADLIARRFGPPSWQDSVKKRLNLVESLCLK